MTFEWMFDLINPSNKHRMAYLSKSFGFGIAMTF